MSIASVATQQSTAAAASAASGSTTASAATDPLASLSSNFNDFLSMLMTQLKNQDPTSPMDTNQFTSELVQFSSVEQQINTNTSLTQLIQLTQGGKVMQASAITGKQVTASSDHVPLQNGQGTIQFNTPTIYGGTKFENVRLEFREGKIVSASANNSKRLNEILDTDALALFERIGLRDGLTPQRSNGLRSMVERIRAEAKAALAPA